MNHRSWLYILFFVLVLAGNLLVGEAADALTWKFEATVVVLDDPLDEFGDVQLGDTIRGTFSYDPAIEPDPPGETNKATYEHPSAYAGVLLEIENPRTDEGLLFVHDPTSRYRAIVFSNDGPFDSSWVLLAEFAIPPTPQIFPWVTMEFAGDGLLADTSLPTQWNLDDWPVAALYLVPASFGGTLDAQIYSITPVIEGDYDSDGEVGRGDYAAWRDAYGETGYHDADGTRDGVVNAADYVVWRNNYETVIGSAQQTASMSSVSTLTSVPEPSAVALLACGVVGIGPTRRFARLMIV